MSESFVELAFPGRGVDVSMGHDVQRPLTTPDAVNVVTFEPITGRAKGGSRPGLGRFINAKVNGTAQIQHMNLIVSIDPEALIDELDDPDGTWGPDFDDNNSVDDPSNLGRGRGRRVRRGGSAGSGSKNKLQITLSASAVTAEVGGSVTITGVVTRRGLNQSGEHVQLYTTPPPGFPPYGDEEISALLSGEVEWVVTHSVAELVRYRARVLTLTETVQGVPLFKATSNIVSVLWTEVGADVYTCIVDSIEDFDAAICEIFLNGVSQGTLVLDYCPPFTLFVNHPVVGEEYSLIFNDPDYTFATNVPSEPF